MFMLADSRCVSAAPSSAVKPVCDSSASFADSRLVLAEFSSVVKLCSTHEQASPASLEQRVISLGPASS